MIKNPFSSTGKNTKIASCNENIIRRKLGENNRERQHD